MRKKGANALVFLEEMPDGVDPAPDPALALVQRATAAEVRAAVAKLPEPLRAAVILRYFEDFDVAHVAEALEISVSAAKVRLWTARRRLAESLSLTAAPKGASISMNRGDRSG